MTRRVPLAYDASPDARLAAADLARCGLGGGAEVRVLTAADDRRFHDPRPFSGWFDGGELNADERAEERAAAEGRAGEACAGFGGGRSPARPLGPARARGRLRRLARRPPGGEPRRPRVLAPGHAGARGGGGRAARRGGDARRVRPAARSEAAPAERARDAARRAANQAVRDLAASGADAEAHAPEGDPVERLIAAAADHRADAILVGARGNTRLDRVRLGRVATGVAERPPLTVEVVRAG